MDVASFGYPDLINHYDPENGDTFQRYSDIRLGIVSPFNRFCGTAIDAGGTVTAFVFRPNGIAVLHLNYFSGTDAFTQPAGEALFF